MTMVSVGGMELGVCMWFSSLDTRSPDVYCSTYEDSKQTMPYIPWSCV